MPDASRVQAEIQKVISDDPTIMDANRIIVSVEKRGFWPVGKEVVVLKGSVHTASDKAKVAKVASLHSFGREVLDDIIVIH
jgi:tetrahydromethanopterin S-methyltransferase subunit A